MYYKTKEVADLLCVNPTTIIRMIERGELPGVAVGKQYRIPKSYVDALPGIRAVANVGDEAE